LTMILCFSSCIFNSLNNFSYTFFSQFAMETTYNICSRTESTRLTPTNLLNEILSFTRFSIS
jgi:hypothetical protein